jgi:hypothetical protein
MQLLHVKAIFAMAWVLVMSIAIVAADLSLVNSTVLACLAVFVPIAIVRWSNDPHPVAAKAVHEVIR